MNVEQIRNAMAGAALFAGLDADRLDVLAIRARTKDIGEGREVYAKGAVAEDTFSLIASGGVKVVSQTGLTLERLGPGQIIGEIGALNPGKKRTITVVAESPTLLLEWRSGDIEADVPEVMKRLKDLAWRRLANWYE